MFEKIVLRLRAIKLYKLAKATTMVPTNKTGIGNKDYPSDKKIIP